MKALFTLTNLLLLAAAAWLTVGLFYQTATSNLSRRSDEVIVRKGEISAPAQPKRPLTGYAAVTRRNLFNTGATEESNASEQKIDIAALQETELDLRLWGTVVTGEERGDYAVIEDKKTRRQELYRVGDPIQNARVKAILRERVVLNVEGKDEVLAVEDAAAAAGPVAAAPPKRSAARPVRRNMVVSRRTVENTLGNEAELMKQIRVRPHFEEGRPAGVSLTGIQPTSLFYRLGIRSGDVLQEVDGRPIKSLQDLAALYAEFESADALQLRLKRRGRQLDIQYQVQD